MLVKLLLIVIVIILLIIIMFANSFSYFDNVSNIDDENDNNQNGENNKNEKHDNLVDVKMLLIEDDTIKPDVNNIKDVTKKECDIMSKIWNVNNTLETIDINKYSGNDFDRNELVKSFAPEWWYPKDKYNPDKFKEEHNRDSINPLYDYLGNAQYMYWDFKAANC